MTTSEKGRELVERFEGLRLDAYLDSVGVATIGYGHTHEVTMGMTCTREQADAWLAEDLRVAELAIECTVHVDVTQNQFDAMVSLTYNIGSGNFEKSSVLRYVNIGRIQDAADAFLLWSKAGGKFLQGLYNRRESERALFLEAS